MNLRPVLICYLVATTVAPAPAPAQTASGIGTTRCDDFMAAVERGSQPAVDGYLSWAQGYISGFNAANAARRQVQIDHVGLGQWLVDYCAGHGHNRFFEAVNDAIAVHAR